MLAVDSCLLAVVFLSIVYCVCRLFAGEDEAPALPAPMLAVARAAVAARALPAVVLAVARAAVLAPALPAPVVALPWGWRLPGRLAQASPSVAGCSSCSMSPPRYCQRILRKVPLFVELPARPHRRIKSRHILIFVVEGVYTARRKTTPASPRRKIR
jgi:hypothetical protein